MARVSAIIATRGNIPLDLCIQSLLSQPIPVEIIVVDQCDGDHAKISCERCEGAIKRIVSQKKGASAGRNIGLEQATGNYIIFPDDDCYYAPDFLSKALHVLDADDLHFVAGLSRDPISGEADGVFKKVRQQCPITRKNVLYTFIEYTLVFRAEVLSRIRFDENLGVGSSSLAWSDEGVDILVRAMSLGAKGRYDPRLVAYHPDKAIQKSFWTYGKVFRYAIGRGHTLRRHRLGAGITAREYFRPMAAMVLYGLSLNWKAKYYATVIAGKTFGYFYRPTNATS